MHRVVFNLNFVLSVFPVGAALSDVADTARTRINKILLSLRHHQQFIFLLLFECHLLLCGHSMMSSDGFLLKQQRGARVFFFSLRLKWRMLCDLPERSAHPTLPAPVSV